MKNDAAFVSTTAVRVAVADRDRGHAEDAGVRLTGVVAASRSARLLCVETEGGPAILKTATEATMLDPVARRRFAREGRAGLTLRHPHLVETLRCGDEWILLGKLDAAGTCARNLLHHVREAGPLAPAEVEKRMSEVGDALAYMHAKGFVHRDIKPGNILVAGGGHTVVIDLGAVGFTVDDDLDHAELIGSPAWMAPEQVRGGPAQPGADVWSLAMVTLFSLGGRSAYEGTATAVLRQRRADAGAPPAFCEQVLDLASAPLRELVTSSLATDPRSRPPARAFARLGRGSGRTTGPTVMV